MEGTVRLHWIRHGETQANAERRYLGHSDSPLTELGLQQCRQLGDRISAGRKELRIHRLYSSDLGRCTVMAVQLGEALRLEAAADSRLRELHFGCYEGHTYDELMERDSSAASAWLENPFDVPPPCGETLTELAGRLDEWLESMWIQWSREGCASSSFQSSAIVTHGGVIRYFVSRYVLGDVRSYWAAPLVPHGGLLSVEPEEAASGRFPRRWRIVE